jgi:hypothetical protein
MSAMGHVHQQLAELAELMQTHDWLYRFSDDQGHWSRSQARSDQIVRLSDQLTRAGHGPEVQLIWRQSGPGPD